MNYNTGNNNPRVEKAVIAASGYGTRLLPYTTVLPKEMLPIGNKPLIQLLIDECLDAGINDITVTTRSNSDIVRNHFLGNKSYADYLRDQGNTQWLEFVEGAPEYANVQFVEADPSIPYGNAQGVLTLKNELLRYSNFLLLWGDDLVIGNHSSIKQQIETYAANKCDASIGIQKKPLSELKHFGNPRFAEQPKNKIIDIITKPKTTKEIASDYAIFGQMILPSNIFDFLVTNNGEEPDITGIALKQLAKEGVVLGSEVTGNWVTTGDPINYFKAQLAWAIHNGLSERDLIQDFRDISNGSK